MKNEIYLVISMDWAGPSSFTSMTGSSESPHANGLVVKN